MRSRYQGIGHGVILAITATTEYNGSIQVSKIRIMAEPTLVQVFGASATQTATTLTITKADLPGLTASANNTAESLLVAILLKAKTQLTDANQALNIEQSLTINDGFIPTYVIRNEQRYQQDTFTVAMDKPAGNTTIDPDDY